MSSSLKSTSRTAFSAGDAVGRKAYSGRCFVPKLNNVFLLRNAPTGNPVRLKKIK